MTNEELIAKIKAEIERQRKFIEGMFIEGDNNFYDGQDDAYNNILTFLSTLESEKPMNQEGLEEEIDRLWESFADEMEGPHNLFDIYARLARHFAQWGAEHSNSSETPNDLKEAVKNYIYKAADSPGDDWTTDDIRNAYIAGYKLHEANTPLPEDTVLFQKGVEEGKRLMMEESVKWLVDDDYHELTEKGRFILGSVGIGYNGYYIPYSDLLKLPKEDEK